MLLPVRPSLGVSIAVGFSKCLLASILRVMRWRAVAYNDLRMWECKSRMHFTWENCRSRDSLGVANGRHQSRRAFWLGRSDDLVDRLVTRPREGDSRS